MRPFFLGGGGAGTAMRFAVAQVVPLPCGAVQLVVIVLSYYVGGTIIKICVSFLDMM